MSDMKCPFCQQRLLQEYNRQRDAVIYHCTHCYFQGDGILWQELIRTRKALDVAIERLSLIAHETFQGEPGSINMGFHVRAEAALADINEITALEQKNVK